MTNAEPNTIGSEAQRVGRLANVGTKVRNKNETAKFFGDFFIPQHHFPLFDTTKGGMIYFHRFSHPCYAFRRWADTWVTPLLSGEIGVF